MLNNGHTSCYRHPATKDKELRVAIAGGVVYFIRIKWSGLGLWRRLSERECRFGAGTRVELKSDTI